MLYIYQLSYVMVHNFLVNFYSFHMQKSYFREIKYITDSIAVSFAGLTKDIRLVLRKALNYVETIEE